MPCFGKAPAAGVTWHRPQIPRPPHTESMSTPSDRAASRTVVPVGTRPRRPGGVKMTSGSAEGAPGGIGSGRPDACAGKGSPTTVDATPAGLAIEHRLAVRPDPA